MKDNEIKIADWVAVLKKAHQKQKDFINHKYGN
mgnify:CR=1 FL=1